MLARVKKLLRVAFVLSLLSIVAMLYFNKQSKGVKLSRNNSPSEGGVGIAEKRTQEEMTIAVVGCKDYRRHWRQVMGNLTRQKVQLFTLIKSIAIFSTRPTHFILITDSQDTYDQLVDFVFNSKHPDYQPHWPDEYRSKFRLSRRQVMYPLEMEKIRFKYVACATSKLFLGLVFPDIDAAIVVDTDFLFFRPLDDLWNQFKNFDENQLYGFAPSHAFYDSKRNKLPYCGATGINSGLIMVNFTRMKPISQFIIDSYINIYEAKKDYLKFGNQGFFNMFCAQHSEYFYHIGCDWNVQPHFCTEHGAFKCEEGLQGISAFHATGGMAISNKDAKITAMFDVIKRVKLTEEDLMQLPTTLLTELQNIDNKKLPDPCVNFPIYNSLLTKHMKDFFIT